MNEVGVYILEGLAIVGAMSIVYILFVAMVLFIDAFIAFIRWCLRP